MTPLLIFLLLLLFYSAASGWMERTVVTAPMLFAAGGVLTASFVEVGGAGHDRLGLFLTIAEVGLALTLFTDASRTNLSLLKSIRALPTRLLSTGMLLTLALGMGLAFWMLPGITLWEAGALAAVLAPTDAGLGLVIVNSPKVPERIRQALNVEAGLNDGLSVPFLMFFIAMTLHGTESTRGVLVRFAVEQLGYGALVGMGCGLVGGWLMGIAHRRHWMAESFERIGVVILPLLCLVISKPIGASVFIAAFVAGLAAQIGYREVGRRSVELTEEWGQMLNLAVFFLFGMLIPGQWAHVTPAIMVYAALSLTVIRMLPVALALRGSGLSASSVWFMGWFGPRGLASIVLGLIYFEHEVKSAGSLVVQGAVLATVLFSVFAHGLSAKPGIAMYARSLPAEPTS